MESQYQGQEAFDYFSDEGFSRLFASARRKYESLGRVGGTIRLARLHKNEREKLSGLLSRSLMKQNSVTVKLQELQEVLLSSRFEIDLPSLLSLIYGEEIKPKAVQHYEGESAWIHFVDQLYDLAGEMDTKRWIEGLLSVEGYGYRAFRELFDLLEKNKEGCEELKAGVTAVIRAVDCLPVRKGNMQPLAVFAAEHCGDPHFFDRDQMWGRLFYYGILFYLAYHEKDSQSRFLDETGESRDGFLHMEESDKATSYFVRKQYEKVGIRLDSLSSQVMVVDVDERLQVCSYGITLDTIERFKQRWQGMAEEQANAEVNDDDVDSITGFVKRVLSAERIFVNENPAVCEAMMGYLTQKKEIDPNNRPVPFICTSGQPSVAALALLDFFAAHEVEIYYSGDLDVKGLEMAIALERRYPSLWHPWGMTSSDIWDILRATEQKQAGVSFSEEERVRLQKLTCDWDPLLIEELLDGGRKIYQEMLISILLEEYLLNGKKDIHNGQGF